MSDHANSPGGGRVVERADAQDWLLKWDGQATVVVYDPPYAVGTPVRGREDGAAGSVFGPFSFLSRTLEASAHALRPGGVVMIFADWRRMPDLAYVATTVGLRASTQIAWVRTRPGTGGLFRASWDPILIASRGVPDAIDRAAIRNVIETAEWQDGVDVVEANYPGKRTHPYEKPPEVYEHTFRRICRPDDLVLDPFAGSRSSQKAALNLGLRWAGCDIDPSYSDTEEVA